MAEKTPRKRSEPAAARHPQAADENSDINRARELFLARKSTVFAIIANTSAAVREQLQQEVQHMLDASIAYGRAHTTAAERKATTTINNGELEELRKKVKELGTTMQTLAARVGVSATATQNKAKGTQSTIGTIRIGKNTDKR